ncbi:urease accessory protein UreD [Litoreibacter janthinus]|uniref:Urease accessory protein UreD n=1 Tax=Litoreibacter janthinus TaxID=670154 RepID=A0A1I6FWB4_9RHOB|nr:urease accessory protein UreD [Litoreibacter janthinus]SFR34229.1 urease accessory protein [Litoreibacter janthinus]
MLEAAILHTANPEPHESVPRQPRAVGAGQVSVRASETGQTRLANLRQSGSLKLVFPQTHRPDAEAIIVNTAGGITGGDRFEVSADVGAGATLTLTTQAAERAYKAQTGEVGRVKTRLTVAEDAQLNWLPQEMILFDNSALCRRLDIALASRARLLMVEPLVFGRAAMKETLTQVNFDDRIQINRGGRAIYLDGMRLLGDAAAHLARPAIANGAGAMATLVMVSPDAAPKLDAIRALLPKTAGASMIAEDVLVLRLLASDSFEMRRSLVPVLDLLTHNTLPTSWRL